MNCDLGPLIDDYLDNALSRTDLQRLERHLGACPHCADEMRERLAFERSVKQALEASVQPLRLPSAASRRILCAVDGQVQQPPLSHQFIRLIPMMSGVAIVALLLAGLFLFLSQISAPLGMERTALLPANQLRALDGGGLLVEPREIHPGDLFTVKFPLERDQFPARKSILCTLEISGPSGRYLFVLAMERPSVISGRSVLQVTPDALAAYCQEQYQISPAEILSVPGVYRFRVTLSGQSAAPGQ
jgi:hypothetical protein